MTDQLSSFSFSLNPEVTAAIHDDGIVLLHSGKGRVFSANQTGARIWRRLEQQRSLDGIAEELSSEFQIARATAHAHMLNFLAALEQQALINREVLS